MQNWFCNPKHLWRGGLALGSYAVTCRDMLNCVYCVYPPLEGCIVDPPLAVFGRNSAAPAVKNRRSMYIDVGVDVQTSSTGYDLVNNPTRAYASSRGHGIDTQRSHHRETFTEHKTAQSRQATSSVLCNHGS